MGAGQGEGSSPSGERCARLVVDVPGPLSRGAWYRVLSAGPEETVVVVRNHAVILPRRSLEIVNTRPSRQAIDPSVVDRRYFTLSSDQQTLTMTVYPTGRNKPDILVFDRE